MYNSIRKKKNTASASGYCAHVCMYLEKGSSKIPGDPLVKDAITFVMSQNFID